jgi:hypothetical protein
MDLAELRDHLLGQLGVLGIGAQASADDAKHAETVLTNAQGTLEKLGVALWSIDDVPDWAIESFIKYAAPMAAPRFGLAEQYPIQLTRIALAELRELTSDGHTPTARALYF